MRFSTSFFHATILTLLCASLAGCAYVIPDNPNPPRYNELIGDRHRPQLNNVRGKTSALPRPMQSGETAQVEIRDLPATNPAVSNEKEVSSNDVAPGTPVSDRRVPVENAQFQMAAAGYPDITSVPPRPAMNGPDSAKERLNAVQSTLEKDRAVAQQSKETLAKDAAEEPSMLSDLPKTDGVVPPNDPVRVVPVEQPNRPAATPAGKPSAAASYPPVASLPRTTVPGMTPEQSLRYSANLPPPPPAPYVMASVAPATTRPAYVMRQPASSYTEQPPMLPALTTNTPPLPAATLVVASAPMNGPRVKPGDFNPLAVEMPVAASGPTVKRGDFDPLAAAAEADSATAAANVKTTTSSVPSAYATNGYITPSRYIDRRY